MPLKIFAIAFCLLSNLLIFAQASDLLPSLIPIKKGKLWGYCNPQKQIIIQPQFESADLFHNNVAAVKKLIGDSVKTGLIDTTGKLVIPYEYDDCYTSSLGNTYLSNRYVVKLVRQSDGSIFIPVKYEVISGFTHHTYIARKAGKYGVIDDRENILIPFKFKNILSLDEKGYAFVEDVRHRQGFIDSSGKQLIPVKRRKFSFWVFRDDMATIMKKDKYGLYKVGFMNRMGKVVIPPIYEGENGFSEGFCAVYNGSRTGFINKRGDTVVPFIYAGAGQFKNGLADFAIYSRCGLIDASGKEVLRLNGNNLDYFNDSFIVITQSRNMNPTYGLFDIKGNELLPCTYHLIGFPEDNLVIVVDEKMRMYYMDLHLNKYLLQE